MLSLAPFVSRPSCANLARCQRTAQRKYGCHSSKSPGPHPELAEPKTLQAGGITNLAPAIHEVSRRSYMFCGAVGITKFLRVSKLSVKLIQPP